MAIIPFFNLLEAWKEKSEMAFPQLANIAS